MTEPSLGQGLACRAIGVQYKRSMATHPKGEDMEKRLLCVSKAIAHVVSYDYSCVRFPAQG